VDRAQEAAAARLDLTNKLLPENRISQGHNHLAAALILLEQMGQVPFHRDTIDESPVQFQVVVEKPDRLAAVPG
jgi:hypothetical protein